MATESAWPRTVPTGWASAGPGPPLPAPGLSPPSTHGTTTTTRPSATSPTTPGPSAPQGPGSQRAGAAPVATSTEPLWTVPASGQTSALPATNRQYRGQLEFTAADGPLRVVNHLDVEDYLRGMGEVLDPDWPSVSLQAQAVASRTYAL